MCKRNINLSITSILFTQTFPLKILHSWQNEENLMANWHFQAVVKWQLLKIYYKVVGVRNINSEYPNQGRYRRLIGKLSGVEFKVRY